MRTRQPLRLHLTTLRNLQFLATDNESRGSSVTIAVVPCSKAGFCELRDARDPIIG